MSTCRWMPKVERWFDGERTESAAIEGHVAACPACATHLAWLREVRAGIETVSVRETIGTSQLPAFLDGIRGRVEQPARGHRGFWALASLSVAALVVALAAFTLLTGGPTEVQATEIESIQTDLEGASVTTYMAEDGTPTVLVSVPRDASP